MSSIAVVFHPSDPTTIFSAITLATTPVQSTVYDIRGYRQIALEVTYSGNQAAQRLFLVPLLSNDATQPSSEDNDVWFSPVTADPSVSASAESAVPTGSDYSTAPEWSRVTVRPTSFSFEAVDNATDEVRAVVIVNCAGCRWFHASIGEQGAGTAGVATVRMTRSC